MKMRVHIVPRTPLFVVRPFGAVKRFGQRGAIIPPHLRRAADMQFRKIRRDARPARTSTTFVNNNISLTPRFALLVTWFHRSMNQLEQSQQFLALMTSEMMQGAQNVTALTKYSASAVQTIKGRGHRNDLHVRMLNSGPIQFERSTRLSNHQLNLKTTRQMTERIYEKFETMAGYINWQRTLKMRDPVQRLNIGRTRHLTRTRRDFHHLHRSFVFSDSTKTNMARHTLNARGTRVHTTGALVKTQRNSKTSAQFRSAVFLGKPPMPLTGSTPFDRQLEHRSTPPAERTFRAVENPQVSPRPAPPDPVLGKVQTGPQFDLNRLETDLWHRFERRIRIEQERRGRH